MTSVLLATGAGRAGTARTIRWAPVAAVPALSSAAVLLAGLLASGRGGAAVDVLGEAGLVLTPATAAFVADGVAGGPAPATPVGRRERLVARAAVVAPAVALGWGVVLLCLAAVGDGAVGSPVTRLLVAVAIAVGSTAAALEVDRRSRVPTAGGAAFAVVLVGEGVVVPVLPSSWLDALPPAALLAVAATAASVAVLAAATREPVTA